MAQPLELVATPGEFSKIKGRPVSRKKATSSAPSFPAHLRPVNIFSWKDPLHPALKNDQAAETGWFARSLSPQGAPLMDKQISPID